MTTTTLLLIRSIYVEKNYYAIDRSDLDKWDTYIVGLSPSGVIPRKVIYILHVGKCITFADAWRRGERNQAYELKRGGHSPLEDDKSRVRMNGDIIVCTRDNHTYQHVGGVHEKDWDTID